ncbi:MAG: VanZ family protein [Candidatus Omnitrophica bacterium]|nr:VanZ family protein [Candidatus Omnitrophota bacterium]
MLQIRKFLSFWFPVLLYSAIIFAASSIQNVALPGSVPNFDKVLHIGEYVVLGLLLARALNSIEFKLSLKQIWLLAAVLCFIYGLTDEWHQSFVPGRTADIWDAIADFIGGGLGGWIWLFIKR